MKIKSLIAISVWKRILVVLFLIVALKAESQNGNHELSLSRGTTIEYEIVSYPIPLTTLGVKWVKMKPEKKIETVTKYNEEVKSGIVKPTAKVPQYAKITDLQEIDGVRQYIGTSQINAKLTIISRDDSVYYLQNDGKPFPIIKEQKDTIGVMYYGVRRFPAKIEVGTMLPGSYGEMNLFQYDLKTSRREFFNFSGGDGYSYYGFVNIRKTTTMQVNSITVNTPFFVSGVEEMEISGKKYVVYKLLNEQWTKLSNNAVVQDDPTVYFGDEYLSDKIKDYMVQRGKGWDTPERIAKIQAKMDAATGMRKNDQGYLVNAQESWYAPELGLMVKSKMYDGTGALQIESKVVSIK